jgi:hypothetical protein
MNLNEDFKKIPEALDKLKEVDIVKYTELLIEYMKVETLRDINKRLIDIDFTIKTEL